MSGWLEFRSWLDGGIDSQLGESMFGSLENGYEDMMDWQRCV